MGKVETCKRNKLLESPTAWGWHLLTFSYPCLSWFAGPQTVGPGTGATGRLPSSSGNCSPPPPALSSCLPLSSSLLGASAWGGQISHGAGKERKRTSLREGWDACWSKAAYIYSETHRWCCLWSRSQRVPSRVEPGRGVKSILWSPVLY